MLMHLTLKEHLGYYNKKQSIKLHTETHISIIYAFHFVVHHFEFTKY